MTSPDPRLLTKCAIVIPLLRLTRTRLNLSFTLFVQAFRCKRKSCDGAALPPKDDEDSREDSRKYICQSCGTRRVVTEAERNKLLNCGSMIRESELSIMMNARLPGQYSVITRDATRVTRS